MSKDPAVLFYTSDFLTGTEFFTFEQKGQYIQLLCVQHQNGHIPTEYMQKILETATNPVWSKFTKDDNGSWYQNRMEVETKRRKQYSESRRKNISNRYDDTYVDTYVGDMKPHMETGTGTETKDVIDLKEQREDTEQIISETLSQWNEFASKNGLSVVVIQIVF